MLLNYVLVLVFLNFLFHNLSICSYAHKYSGLIQLSAKVLVVMRERVPCKESTFILALDLVRKDGFCVLRMSVIRSMLEE